MKTTTRRIAAACLFLVLAAGCDRMGGDRITSSPETDKSKSVGNVAVIDLDAVAEQLGHKVQIQNAIRQRDKDYAEQLGVIKANYEQKLAEIKQGTGETPTPEQSKYVVQSANEFNRSLQQNTAKARQALGSYQTSLIQQYRTQVKQVAQEVAAERGFTDHELEQLKLLPAVKFVGTHESVLGELDALIEATGVQELMLTGSTYGAAPKINTYRALTERW